MEDKALFLLSDIEFSYNQDPRPRLTIPSLKLTKGSVTVIEGSNGSGKTTLLKLLNRLLIPHRGIILMEGEEAGEEQIREKSLYLHQDPYLFSGTVERNLNMVLRIKKVAPQLWKDMICEKLGLVGLSHFQKHKCHELSGGEKKRLSLARALLAEPQILLLDEPDANIDRENMAKLEDILLTLQKKGLSIIMSTHSKGFAYRIGEEFIHLENGSARVREVNIYRGTYSHRQGHYGFFQIGHSSLAVPGLQGDFKTAVLSPKDLILSEKKIESSAQNQWEGEVLSYGREGSLYSITLAIPERVISHITGESFKKLQIEIGKKFIVMFKASAVELY